MDLELGVRAYSGWTLFWEDLLLGAPFKMFRSAPPGHFYMGFPGEFAVKWQFQTSLYYLSQKFFELRILHGHINSVFVHAR